MVNCGPMMKPPMGVPARTSAPGTRTMRPELELVFANGPGTLSCMMLLLGNDWNTIRVSAVSVWTAKMLPMLPPTAAAMAVRLTPAVLLATGNGLRGCVRTP